MGEWEEGFLERADVSAADGTPSDSLPAGGKRAATWPTWAVVAFTGVILVLKTITPSAGERSIWLPVVLVLLASSLTVALTAGRTGAQGM